MDHFGQNSDLNISAAPNPTANGQTITLGLSRPQSKPAQRVQRALDILVSCLALLLLLPIFTIISLVIKLDSPGSVLFIQRRVGRRGVLFPMYKFRSMVRNAETLRATLEASNERDGPVFKMRRDPRITRVGRVLRKYSLDELPQLVNVLKGEMSLIGPRPALPAEVARYTPRQRRRLTVRPGLTGLWQVSGRSSLSFERSVEFDLYYIQNQSLALNLHILIKTVPAVVAGEGAY